MLLLLLLLGERPLGWDGEHTGWLWLPSPTSSALLEEEEDEEDEDEDNLLLEESPRGN